MVSAPSNQPTHNEFSYFNFFKTGISKLFSPQALFAACVITGVVAANALSAKNHSIEDLSNKLSVANNRLETAEQNVKHLTNFQSNMEDLAHTIHGLAENNKLICYSIKEGDLLETPYSCDTLIHDFQFGRNLISDRARVTVNCGTNYEALHLNHDNYEDKNNQVNRFHQNMEYCKEKNIQLRAFDLGRVRKKFEKPAV